MDNSSEIFSTLPTSTASVLSQGKSLKLFHHHEAVILAAVVSFLSIFGIFANSMTFYVIAKSSKLSASPFNIMIMSLCISDLLSALDSPFVLYRRTFGYYIYYLPNVACKLTFAVDFWTTNATIQHILVFMILRIVALQFPTKAKNFTVKIAKILACCIWAETCIANFVFYMIFPTVYPPSMKSPSGKACTVNRDLIKYLRNYMNIAYPIFLYIPMLAVLLLSIFLLAKIASKRSKKHAVTETEDCKKENFALIQLSLIVASFLCGYIPDIAYRITTISHILRGEKFHGRGPWQFLMAAHMCLRISECLNPIFYNLASSTLRKATKDTIAQCFGRKKEVPKLYVQETKMETLDAKSGEATEIGESKF